MVEFRKVLTRMGSRILEGGLYVLGAAGSRKVVLSLILLLSFSISLLLRIAPIRWGVYLNEFDPFYEYYLAEKVLEHSKNSIVEGIAWWFSWWFDHGKPDPLFWAPKGRDLRRTSQPGAAIFSSTICWVLKGLGLDVSLYTVHAFLPPVGASLAVFAIFLLGREVKNAQAGAISALLISISWSFIYRTNLGAKHEGIAIPFMALAFYLFLRAYRKNSLLTALLAGLSLGMVVLSWGAYLYPWNFLGLVTLLWLLLHPTDVRMGKVFLATNIVGQLFIAITPRFGPRVAFCSIASAVPMAANIASILVLMHRLALPREPGRTKLAVVSSSIALIIGFLAAWRLGIVAGIAGRILAIVVPLWREVGVTTVAEHAVPGWASLFSDYKTILLFALFGGFVSFRRIRRDLRHTFLSLLLLTSLYAAGSMARLTLLLAPAVSVVGAYGFTEIVDSAMEVLTAKPARYKALKKKSINKDAVALVLVIVILLLAPSVLNVAAIMSSHQPPLILTSSVPLIRYHYQYTDWLSALEWIRANIPEDATIATWWDYGYWISVNTRRKTTCDNATIDTRQIQKIARAFLSPEEEALQIFKELGVDYVVVYEPFLSQPLQFAGIDVYYSVLSPALGGDLAKSAQMARWIHRDPSKYLQGYGTGNYAQVQTQTGRAVVLVPADTPEARNATLYKLLFAKTGRRRYFIFEPFPFSGGAFPGYDGPVFSMDPPKHFKLVYASEPNEWVLVFKVVYNETGG